MLLQIVNHRSLALTCLCKIIQNRIKPSKISRIVSQILGDRYRASDARVAMPGSYRSGIGMLDVATASRGRMHALTVRMDAPLTLIEPNFLRRV
jgi:hypothetical protein